MVHRTPISKISLPDGVNLAAARDADKTFKETVCRPEQKTLEKKINKVIAEKTDALIFKLNELTLTDELEQAKIDQIYATIQVDMPNEIRQRRGLPGREGGDKPLELKPQQASEQASNATSSRARDKQRNANPVDSVGAGRNAKGEGRATA